MSNQEHFLSPIEYPELPTVTFDKKFVEEQIVLLYFQSNRKNEESLDLLSDLFKNLLDYLTLNLHIPIAKDYLGLLYRMIGQTRDCYSHGKGEQQVAYIMIYVWFSFFPDMALYAVKSFVVGKYSYGSWRDIKYLCQYVRSKCRNENHPIICYCIWLMNYYLHNDFLQYIEMSNMVDNKISTSSIKTSLVAKWIPREHKKFHWLFDLLVLDWFSTYQTTILSKCEYNNIKYHAAISKCKRLYRQMVASLNKNINTLEINLCAKEYTNIKPDTIPQIAFMKYKKLLLNDTAFNTHKYYKSTEIGVSYINKKISEQNIAMHFYLKHFPNDLGCLQCLNEEPVEKKMLSHLPIAYYVTEALKIIGAFSGLDNNAETGGVFQNKNIISNRDILNKQWVQMSNNMGNKRLHGMIPFLDMSETMYGESLNTAIGIACLIAERTTFGKKILVYDNQPTWVNLDHCVDGDFVSMIDCLYHSTNKTTKTRSNFTSALQLLVDALVFTDYSEENIRLLKCVFISNQYSVFRQIIIKNMFLNNNKPCPIIVNWNVSLGCFPDIKVEPGCFFFSGESVYPLRMLDINHIASPFEVVQQVLRHERYDLLDKYAVSVL